MRRAASILVLLGAALAAVVFTGASSEAEGKKYWVEFDNAFGLVEGGDLKIGGVRAGTVNKFELTDTEPYKVLVEVEVAEPGFDALRTDSECRVRNQSLIGEYYVDCEVGKADEEIPEGGTIPVERTSSSIPPDLIASVMRRPYRERFRLLLSELGVGLAGRPEELNEVIKRAHPALKEVNETLEILDRQNETIRDFITDADKVSAAVEPKKEQLSRWAQEAMETAEIQASRADSLQAQWNKLPTFLGELRPTLAQLDATASEQIPFLRRMHAAAPDFYRLLKALERFSNASRGSTRALGETAVVGRKALTESARGDRGAARAVRGRAAAREAAAAVPPDDRRPRALGRGRPAPQASSPRRRRTRRPRRTARASPAWRRSSTTSTGRRSGSTASTRSATSCASSSCATTARRTRTTPPSS